MNKFTLAGLLTSLALMVPLATSAAEFRGAQDVSLVSGETISGNMYMAGGNIIDTGVVKGDLVIGGGNILVSGPVNSDLLIGGGSINVTSDIGGDLRIGGGNITIQGKVAGDAIVGGGQIILASPHIGGDVAIAGGNITISAPINGSLKVFGGQVTLNAPVKGSVIIHGQKITLGPKAIIQGDLTYTSPAVATLETGAIVRGKTDYTKSETSTKANVVPTVALGAFFTFWLLAKLLMSIVGAFLFLWIFPRYAIELATSFATKPLEYLGIGFVAFIVLPIAGILLLLTVIGIPLGALALLGFVGLMIFASLVAPVALGSLVHKWIWKPSNYVVDWKTILLGVAIWFVLGFIPFVGGLLKFIIILMTLGVTLQVKWSVSKNWR